MARRGRKVSTRRKVVRYVQRKKKSASKGLTKAKKLAIDEKHTIAAVSSGLVLGALEQRNIKLPSVDALGVAGTYGLVALILGRQTNNQIFRHVATGLLSIAAYEQGKNFAKKLSGEREDEIEGYGIEDTNDYEYPIVSGTI